jgi:uncharacterized membrane protein
MNVTRKQERLLHRALAEWEQEGALSASDRQRLAATLKRTALDWQRLSRYAIWTALACAIIAIGSLFADSVLMAWIIDFLSFSSLARIGLPALLAMVFYLWGFARQRRETQCRPAWALAPLPEHQMPLDPAHNLRADKPAQR